MKRFHRIFYAPKGIFLEDIEWKDDNNHGLPTLFFYGDFTSFEINLDKDTVEWVPGIGPAPCWEARFSTFKDDAEMWSAFTKWIGETY